MLKHNHSCYPLSLVYMHRKAGECYTHSKIRGHSIMMWNIVLESTNQCLQVIQNITISD